MCNMIIRAYIKHKQNFEKSFNSNNQQCSRVEMLRASKCKLEITPLEKMHLSDQSIDMTVLFGKMHQDTISCTMKWKEFNFKQLEL